MSEIATPATSLTLRIQALRKQLANLEEMRDMVKTELLNNKEDKLLTPRLKQYHALEWHIEELINNLYFLEIGEEPYRKTSKGCKELSQKIPTPIPPTTKPPIHSVQEVQTKIDDFIQELPAQVHGDIIDQVVESIDAYRIENNYSYEQEKLEMKWFELICLRQFTKRYYQEHAVDVKQEGTGKQIPDLEKSPK